MPPPPTIPLKVWIPGKLPGLNQLLDARSKRWRGGDAYWAMKKRHQKDVAEHIRYAWGGHGGRFSRIHVRFEWHEPNRRRNPDNIAAGGRKIILDALVDIGLIENDGWKQVSGWTDTFCCDPDGEPGVHITISEVPDGETG